MCSLPSTFMKIRTKLLMQMKGKAVNVIEFSARGLRLLNGQLKIEASFKVASKSVK